MESSFEQEIFCEKAETYHLKLETRCVSCMLFQFLLRSRNFSEGRVLCPIISIVKFAKNGYSYKFEHKSPETENIQLKPFEITVLMLLLN